MRRQAGDSVVRVYVVADFEPLRVGLANAIASAPDLEIIGWAPSLGEMVRDGSYRESDVIVVDVQTVNQANMPEVYRSVAEWFPALRVLFLGGPEDGRAIAPEDIPTYMGLSSTGFLYKHGDAERFLEAVRIIATDGFVCEADVIKRILTRLSQWANYSGDGRAENLSERQSEVLVMVASGRSNKEIAQELFVSEGTVKVHISHIMTKLALDRRTELVRYALSKGLVQMTDES